MKKRSAMRVGTTALKMTGFSLSAQPLDRQRLERGADGT